LKLGYGKISTGLSIYDKIELENFEKEKMKNQFW